MFDTANRLSIKKNKNFKIAGIATIGLTVTGTAANISLYSKIKDQKKTILNMNNKIKNAGAQTDEFIQDMARLSQNINSDKYALDSSLTYAEKKRFIELYDNDFDLDKLYNGNANDSAISESDKVLLEKMVHAMRNSQKQ